MLGKMAKKYFDLGGVEVGERVRKTWGEFGLEGVARVELGGEKDDGSSYDSW